MENKRIDFIDVAKGIGIILVVLGHLNSAEQPIRNFIYSFHMPLFFILSGIFFNDKTDFKTLLIKSIKTLLIPYLIFVAVDAIVYIIMHNFQWESVTFAIKTRLISMTGARLRITNLPLWFMFALFFIRILYYFIHKVKLLEIITVLAGILLVAVAKYFWYPPKCMYIVALPCVMFYSIGYRLKKHIFDLSSLQFNWRGLILLIVVVISLFITSNINDCVNIYSYKYGNFGLFYLNGILGSATVLLLSVWLSKVKPFSKVLVYLGKNSVVILICHYYLCRIVLPNVMQYIGIGQYLYNYLTQITASVIILVLMIPIICLIQKRKLKYENSKNT